jgi:hypothetical protein
MQETALDRLKISDLRLLFQAKPELSYRLSLYRDY